MSQETKKAKVKEDNRLIEVYKLKEGYPTELHKWCNFKGCTETFTDNELEFL